MVAQSRPPIQFIKTKNKPAVSQHMQVLFFLSDLKKSATVFKKDLRQFRKICNVIDTSKFQVTRQQIC
jgi:hypothetical protein